MKLTNKNYYSQKANQAYFSVSQVKDFLKCEAYAMAKINGEWVEEPTPAMMIGSYVDSYFEGTLEEFKEQNPQIFKKDGTLKSDYIKAEKIIERVSKDELFYEFIFFKRIFKFFKVNYMFYFHLIPIIKAASF